MTETKPKVIRMEMVIYQELKDDVKPDDMEDALVDVAMDAGLNVIAYKRKLYDENFDEIKEEEANEDQDGRGTAE